MSLCLCGESVTAEIDDPEPFYGEIPELQGVWATGKTLEACRDDLMSALEDWTRIQA